MTLVAVLVTDASPDERRERPSLGAVASPRGSRPWGRRRRRGTAERGCRLRGRWGMTLGDEGLIYSPKLSSVLVFYHKAKREKLGFKINRCDWNFLCMLPITKQYANQSQRFLKSPNFSFFFFFSPLEYKPCLLNQVFFPSSTPDQSAPSPNGDNFRRPTETISTTFLHPPKRLSV